MAFDIYAGTITRFFTRDWENVVQRQARLDGTEYRMIYAGGEEAPPPAEEVASTVQAWRDAINRSLAQHSLGPIEWSESGDQPYFTDRPGWEGYSALQLWAAYAERPDRQAPYALPETWAVDKVWQSVVDDEKNIHFRTILQATIWLPGDFEFCFKFPALTEGDEVMIASTASFRNQLRELESKPVQWGSASLMSKLLKKNAVPLEEAAKWGRESFLAIAEKAVEHGLPILLSF